MAQPGQETMAQPGQETVEHDDFTFIRNGWITHITITSSINCSDCQFPHPVIYFYIKPEDEEGFICYENRVCIDEFIQTNNRTGADIIYTVDEVVANLQRQLENGVEVLYM